MLVPPRTGVACQRRRTRSGSSVHTAGSASAPNPFGQADAPRQHDHCLRIVGGTAARATFNSLSVTGANASVW